MPPDFFFEKLISKKIQKSFIVNNTNETIRVWYLSSKWPVCRSIVNHITGGRSRTKFSTFLKTNTSDILPCFAIKWLKCTCNKGIFSIQIMGKWSFVLFGNFFPFNWSAKLVILFFYYFVSPNSCVMLLTVLKLVVHI